MILSYLFHIFIGFLSGSILYSYLWPKWICHIDITQLSDDHNPGTFNAMKLAGPRVGILCLVCDVCKGFFPLWFASKALSWQHPLFAVVLAAPVFGHAYSPFSMGAAARPLPSALAVCWGYGRFVTYSCYWQDSICFSRWSSSYIRIGSGRFGSIASLRFPVGSSSPSLPFRWAVCSLRR